MYIGGFFLFLFHDTIESMIYDDIKNFQKQFEFEPIIENKDKLVHKDRVLVAGMGGSELAAMLVKGDTPEIDFILHRGYGLSRLGEKKLKETLVVAISYSGNTEETLDAFETAIKQNIPVAVIATGGKLLDRAKEAAVPFIVLPNTGMQPRMSLGFMTMALLTLLGRNSVIAELKKLSHNINPADYEEEGKKLAEALHNKIPLIYASKRNEAVAYIWKIKCNENGKIPAFYNIFPELNHNEMTGFDINEETKHIASNFACILLKDSEDYPRIGRRMEVLQQLYRDRGIAVHPVDFEGSSRFFKIFSSIILADWTSYYIALSYHIDPEPVPMVEEFKRMI